MEKPDSATLKALLDRVYADCHRGELIDPDPLLVVRSYGAEADRELVGLFCAVLALGRARAIVDAARRCLEPFGSEPAAAVAELGPAGTRARLGLDAYRFFPRRDLAALLSAAADLQGRFGSLEGAFAAGRPAGEGGGEAATRAGPSARLLVAGDRFVDLVLDSARRAASVADGSAIVRAESSAPAAGLVRRAGSSAGADGLARNLLPAPRDGSACKRLMLFLRWMVRRDQVDIGAWTCVSPAELVMPLDTHIHRISRALGLASRATADLAAALEVTASLRAFDPDDPVRFDFSLSRLGIRSDYSLKDYLNTCKFSISI